MPSGDKGESMETILSELWGMVQAVFTSGSMITNIIAVVIALLAGIFMTRYGAIIYTTIASLVVFAIALFVLGIVQGGKSVDQQAQATWDGFMALSFGAFLVYFIAFFLVISVVYLVKSLVSSR